VGSFKPAVQGSANARSMSSKLWYLVLNIWRHMDAMPFEFNSNSVAEGTLQDLPIGAARGSVFQRRGAEYRSRSVRTNTPTGTENSRAPVLLKAHGQKTVLLTALRRTCAVCHNQSLTSALNLIVELRE
jgi:hypothetical protein